MEAAEEAGVLARTDRTRSQFASLQWQALRKELSVGLELECFLPDLGALTEDRLTPIETKEGLFRFVAERLSTLLKQAHREADVDAASPRPRCRADWRRVSADERDWGSLWTITEDGSIRSELASGSVNPFPVELVSKLMRFDEVDVALFCDMVHTLSSPPISGRANESTGLHVHVGKHPGFFTLGEVVRILKAYIRYEPIMNRLLPLSRQRNQYCLDFRELLAKRSGLDQPASEEQLRNCIDTAAERAHSLLQAHRHTVAGGVQGTVSRETLVSALLGEGLVWCCSRSDFILAERTKVGGETVKHWVAPGMVLMKLSRLSSQGEEVLWKAPSAQDLIVAFAADQDAPPGPLDALKPLGDQADVFCHFALPPEVAPEALELWLFRGALGFLGRRDDRYCKLNLMRIHLPRGKATLEFRQFPGGNFDRALTIWGWVQFIGLFISQSIASPVALPPANGPAATEHEIKVFMQLSTDTLLLAWFRDTLLQQGDPQAALPEVRRRWRELVGDWRTAARAGGEGQALLDACVRWRRVCWTMAGMQQLLPPEDEAWEELRAEQALADRFLQRLYLELERRLADYAEHLEAMEEISRCTSLGTVVAVTIAGGGVQREREEIRVLFAAVMESGGLGKCEHGLRQSIQELFTAANELLLSHIINLLDLCDRAASEFASAADGAGAGAGELSPASAPASIEAAAPGGGAGRRGAGGRRRGAASRRELVRRAYRELCGLLAPRPDEVHALWCRLRERGWGARRVEDLNLRLAGPVLSFRGAPDSALGLE